MLDWGCLFVGLYKIVFNYLGILPAQFKPHMAEKRLNLFVAWTPDRWLKSDAIFKAQANVRLLCGINRSNAEELSLLSPLPAG